jgi:hypothetical protein
MSRPRAARPTDIVALVAFDGQVFANEARPWEQLGQSSEAARVLNSALEQWFSFATGRATWVSVQGQTVRGVISAHRRASGQAWEIDTLIAAAEDAPAVALSLFDQLSAGAVRAGVQKIFLRLEAGSELTSAAHRAGFVTYARETLLRRGPVLPPGRRGRQGEALNPLPDGLPETDEAPPALRPHAKGDAYALFQLYCQSTPAAVRAVEALTFSEWLAAQEKRGRGRGRVDLIAERNSRTLARVRAGRTGEAGRLDLIIHPDAWPHTEALLAAGLSALKPDAPIYTLLREHDRPVAERLEAAGFVPGTGYVALAKRLAVPVREPLRARVPVPALVKPLVSKPLAPTLHTPRTPQA